MYIIIILCSVLNNSFWSKYNESSVSGFRYLVVRAWGLCRNFEKYFGRIIFNNL